MSSNRKFFYVAVICFSMFTTHVVSGNEAPEDSGSTIQHLNFASESDGHVRILLSNEHCFEPTLPTFVITHGMGGTQPNDRFHQLAVAIQDVLPQSNVLLIDWSLKATSTKSFLGIPSPWEVAKNIDPIARHVSEELQALTLDPTRTTFIGESFGNCVNAKIAEHLGRHGKMLAFNPPNAGGGYKIPDLRSCADLTWSFETFSLFDTQDPIAHAGFFLETSVGATDRDQHVAGVSWLADQVRSGNTTWLLMQHQLVNASDGEFDAVAAMSGELRDDQHPSRTRSPEVRAKSRASVTLVTTAL